MTSQPHSDTNRLLGYPADARLLIINADDFGMCHATNAAIPRAVIEQEGIILLNYAPLQQVWQAR